MSSDIKELSIEDHFTQKRAMYLAKEFLLKSEKLNLLASTKSSETASRAAEALTRLGYVTIENIQTITNVHNDRRYIKLIITLQKTSKFDQLYKENEEFKI